MHRSLTVAAALVALASCGKQEASTPKSTEEVVAEAGELARPQPGQYQTSVKLVEFSIPGLPAAQAEQLKGMMGGQQEQSGSYCLTKEQADKGFEESVRKMGEGQNGMNCKFDTFDVDGGKIAAQMQCTGPQGMTSSMKLDGTASSTATALKMDMTQKAAMIPGGEMHMVMQMDSRRTGDCAG